MRLEPLPGGGLRVFAPAKVNLYLEILGVRPDGYHEIDTIMQTVSLEDDLEVRPAPGPGRAAGDARLSIVDGEGGPVELSAGDDNLVLRAARLVRESLPPGAAPVPADILLRKRIPMGAGLGGGSSDGASALVAFDRLWGARLGLTALSGLAARLGSDCAFFLHGGAARCRGRGERMDPLGDLPGCEDLHLVLAYPGFQCPTSLIYRELDRLGSGPVAFATPAAVATMSPVGIGESLRGGDLFFNRLEGVACTVFPELAQFKKEIQLEPFRATLLSGSGSTIYGVTRSRREAEDIAARLRRRLPGRYFVAKMVGGGLPVE